MVLYIIKIKSSYEYWMCDGFNFRGTDPYITNRDGRKMTCCESRINCEHCANYASGNFRGFYHLIKKV